MCNKQNHHKSNRGAEAVGEEGERCLTEAEADPEAEAEIRNPLRKKKRRKWW